MRDKLKTDVVAYDPALGQQIFNGLLNLNNALASLSKAHLSPVPGYEHEIGRERAIVAVGAVIDFLRDTGVAGECREPLLELHMALADAKAGRNNPILKPSPMAPNTPNKHLLPMLDDGMAVAAVEILKKEGIKTAAAIREIATAFGYRPAKLTQLRKEVKSRASAPAMKAYQYWMDEYRRGERSARDCVSYLIETRGFRRNAR